MVSGPLPITCPTQWLTQRAQRKRVIERQRKKGVVKRDKLKREVTDIHVEKKKK